MTHPPPLIPPTPQLPPLAHRTPAQVVARHLRSALVTGIITAIPLFITVSIIQIVYGLVTKYSQLPANSFFDLLIKPLLINLHMTNTGFMGFVQWITVSLLALIFALLVIYILGLLGTFVLGKRLLEAFENLIEGLPLVKGIYGTTKQVIGVFRQGSGGSGFQRVVLVEFPRKGMWTVAFVANTITDTGTGNKMLCLFIPMTPNPTSGFFQIVCDTEVRETDWSVDQGIKIVLSGGLLAPAELNFNACPPAAPLDKTA